MTTEKADKARKKWAVNAAGTVRKHHKYVLRSVNKWKELGYLKVDDKGDLVLVDEVVEALDQDQKRRDETTKLLDQIFGTKDQQ